MSLLLTCIVRLTAIACLRYRFPKRLGNVLLKKTLSGTSYKLLRDGVLWIDYERDVYRISDDRLDSFFIKDIRFYPYGCGESVDFVSILDGEWRPILPD